MPFEMREIHFKHPATMLGSCWIWPRGLSSTGYGNYRGSDGKTYNAHKSAYEIFRGKVPSYLSLDHLCRKRDCVNPWHLEIVTQQENCKRGLRGASPTCSHGHKYTKETTRYRLSKFGTIHRCCKLCQKYYDSRRQKEKQNAIHS